MGTIKVRVILEVPTRLIPDVRWGSRWKKALRAVLTGALAEFQVVVGDITWIAQERFK